jgi:hypothetical protein
MAARIWNPILSTLLGVALSGAAQALVIDDFEGGAFSYSGNSSGDGGSQTVTSPAQVLGGRREVYVESNLFDDTVDAHLAPTPGDDDAVSLVVPASGGLFELSYAPPAPFDMTLGGSATAIEIDMPLGTAGATLEIALTDTLAGSGSLNTAVAGATTRYAFALADFSGVDATRIETVEVSVTSATSGSFEIAHIALRGSRPAMIWEVTQDQVSGPPYPTSLVEIDTRATIPPDPMMALGVTALSIVEARMGIPPDPYLPFELVASGNGELGSGGEQVGIEGNWLPEGLSDEYPDEASFELELELHGTDRVRPKLGYPPDPYSPSPEAFRVSFMVFYENEMGRVVGSSRQHLHFQIGPDQDLEFTNVSSTEGDSGFTITFGTDRMGLDPSPFAPIFTTTLSGEFTQAPSLPALSGAALWLLVGSLLASVVVWVRHWG